VAQGDFAFATAARSFAGTVLTAFLTCKGRAPVQSSPGIPAHGFADTDASLPRRMAEGLDRFKGKLLLILSGKDLTAQEFNEVARASSRWGKLLAAPRVERRDLPEADHTFSAPRMARPGRNLDGRLGAIVVKRVLMVAYHFRP